MAESTPHVYAAICEIAGKLAKEGIGKDKVAQTGRGGSYKFRGIDDIYNALAPYLAEVGLCILPRVLERVQVERLSSNNNALFYTTLRVEFDFVSAKDGSTHTVATFGEAMDSGDKSTNKAMSAAYKYACLQAFCIPTEGDNDSETQTHEVVARNAPPPPAKPAGPTPRQVMELAGRLGVTPQAIPGHLVEAGVLPEPLPSSRWSSAHLEKAVKFYTRELRDLERERELERDNG